MDLSVTVKSHRIGNCLLQVPVEKFCVVLRSWLHARFKGWRTYWRTDKGEEKDELGEEIPGVGPLRVKVKGYTLPPQRFTEKMGYR